MFISMPRKNPVAPGIAASILKLLRVKAGLTVRDMATALGIKTHSAYQYYEVRYKKDHLAPDLYEKVRSILVARGIKEQDVRLLQHAATRAQIEELERRVGNIESLIAEVAVRRAEQLREEDTTSPARSRKPH